jgi:hypothetical protein
MQYLHGQLDGFLADTSFDAFISDTSSAACLLNRAILTDASTFLDAFLTDTTLDAILTDMNSIQTHL